MEVQAVQRTRLGRLMAWTRSRVLKSARRNMDSATLSPCLITLTSAPAPYSPETSTIQARWMARSSVTTLPVHGLGSARRIKGIYLHSPIQSYGKNPADLARKHDARHRKLFKCDEPNCPRKEGFGTINDLARHKKCVHNKEPERGPKMMYLCFGKNCPRPNKKWPRLDNFKQHLSRMHHEEDGDALLKK